MRARLLLLIILSGLLLPQAFAQERTVSGKVTAAENGDALPGVNVVVKGTTNGTVTDVDGNYKLAVDASATTLVYSFIGLATLEVPIGGRSVIDVQLSSDDIRLDEIVVTAVGIEREKKALGYSVENISADQVAQKSEPDVLRALQGKVPGVNITGSTGLPGSATRITIRGASSFLGNNEPLFVVDGTPYNNQQFTTYNQLTGGGAYANALATLDPNNIESITVLKGAAAAALYGSRAANGVVLVTTKAGSSRASRKKLEVTFNSSYSVEEIANLPEYQNLYGNGTEFQYQNSNGSWGAAFSSLDSFPTWPLYTAAFPDLPANLPYEAQPDNVSSLFEKGSVLENSITISGGNERSIFSAVLSTLNQDGYIPFSTFQRNNLSIGGNTELDNGLNVGCNFTYTRSVQEGPLLGENGAQDPGAASSFARTLWLGRTWDTSLPYTNPTTGGPVFFNTLGVDHMLWSWENNGIESTVDRFVANINAGYDITDNLNVTYKIGVNTFVDRRLQIWNIGSTAFGGAGSVLKDDIYFQEIESNLLVTYTKDINEDFNVRAVVGHNVNQRTTDRQQVQGQGIISPGIFDIDNTSSVVPTGGGFSRRRLYGVFGDVSLGYRNYLFLNLTGRNDWSSTLPEENRSFFYPAVSTSFIFTEALGINSNILTSGKLRASWARVGNDALPYQLENTFLVNLGANTNAIGALRDNDLPFLGQPGITQSDVSFDPDLTPEFTKEFELGTALEFYNGRATLNFTYYDRRTTDQIANVTLPSASGFQQLVTNFGEVSNKGIEVGLDVTPVQLNNGLTWNMFVSFTRNRSKVESLADGIERINIRNLFGGSVTPVLEPGQPYGILRGSRSARDEEGNLLINPANGYLFPDLQQGKIGDPNPDFLLGITNSISFKGITLRAVIDYRHGGDLYSTTIERLLGRGVTRDTEDREATRIIEGFLGDPATGLPLLDENGNKIPNTIQVTTNDLFFANGAPIETFGINAADEWSVWDGTVVRLREVSLGYQFPTSLLNKTPFGSASITFTGRNLWYNAPNVPEYTNFDPEVNSFGSTNTQGIEFASAPSSKRYGVNLRLTF